MNNIAIIPARGGSKRIPRKNIKIFDGKPIIAYSIEMALKSTLFKEVMVSTDDSEISQIAQMYGAKVPFQRSLKNSGDHSGTADVLIEVIDYYENNGETFDYGCCIYPTAPFVTCALLEQTFSILASGKADTVFPVTRFSYPIQRALKIEGGLVKMFWPENYARRSQDFTAAYHDAGQFYWFEMVAFKKGKTLFADRTSAVEVSEMNSHDIDSIEDWIIAEHKYRFQKNRAFQNFDEASGNSR